MNQKHMAGKKVSFFFCSSYVCLILNCIALNQIELVSLGCYFMKGKKIGPTDDIIHLMGIAQTCEDDWGQDRGNGWLLRHPLKKLYMFQQYCLR